MKNVGRMGKVLFQMVRKDFFTKVTLEQRPESQGSVGLSRGARRPGGGGEPGPWTWNSLEALVLYADQEGKRKRIQRGLIFHGLLSTVGGVRFLFWIGKQDREGFEQERAQAGWHTLKESLMPHRPRPLSSLLLGALSQGRAKSWKQLAPLGLPDKSGRERERQESGGSRPRPRCERKEEREGQRGVIAQGRGPRSRIGRHKAGQGPRVSFYLCCFCFYYSFATQIMHAVYKKKNVKILISKKDKWNHSDLQI